jgi:hypothetical protein
LRMAWRLAPANEHVVTVKRDVDRTERDLGSSKIGDVASQPLRKGNATRVNSDEGRPREVLVSLHDLVSDAGDRPIQGLGIQEDLARFDLRSHQRLLSGLSGPG